VYGAEAAHLWADFSFSGGFFYYSSLLDGHGARRTSGIVFTTGPSSGYATGRGMTDGMTSLTSSGRASTFSSTQKPRVGRPAHNHHTVLNGILWILRSGGAWRDLPERYGTISSRFYTLAKSGVWTQILQQMQQQAIPQPVGWDVQMIDSTIVRSPKAQKRDCQNDEV